MIYKFKGLNSFIDGMRLFNGEYYDVYKNKLKVNSLGEPIIQCYITELPSKITFKTRIKNYFMCYKTNCTINYKDMDHFKSQWELDESEDDVIVKSGKKNSNVDKKLTKVLITGSSYGIGLATAEYILETEKNASVVGLDINSSGIENPRYTHINVDVRDKHELPNVGEVNILINNAGVQDIDVPYENQVLDTNINGVINCTEKYAIDNPNIKSVVNLASVSAHNGAEFPYYVASKGAVLAYTKWTAKQLAPQATCNSISFGGVLTNLNKHIIDDSNLWDSVMRETPMKKWCSDKEAAEWIWFLANTNKSMTSQDIIVDNGEMYNHNFIW